ncbi:exported hypothetical protein [Verrucomicrobia bacterium]|nr:exported hypothetical protein [Verrucomicrobiota bacterium]
MRSHFSLNRGAAAACAVAGATTLLNGNCSAQTVVAADYATNSTYAAGWSAGQNGGYGFGAWSMDYTEATSPIEADIDRTSPLDPFGVAWTLYNPEGTLPTAGNSPGGQCVNPPTGTDISRAGRAIPGGLQPGETFSTIFANPATRTFYRGYTIVFSNGGDNIQYGGAGTMLSVGTFEYFTYGRWYASGTNAFNNGYTGTTLFDTDTSTNGIQLDVTVTSTNSYHLVMTPLNNPTNTFSQDGGFATNGPITWVTYQLYNTDSDFYPTVATCGPDPTDFYIKSMTISGWTLNIQRIGSKVLLSWPTNAPGFTLVSSTNLVGPVWNPVVPLPSVVNGQNVVTNPITDAQQYYRLQE